MIHKRGALISLLAALWLISTTESYGQRSRQSQPKNIVAAIAAGEVDPAIERLRKRSESNPEDLEIPFLLAMAYTQKNDLDTAMKYVKEAVEGGLPIERFLVGPRNMFKPLVEHAAFEEFAKTFQGELLHGPMLGAVTENSARFWVRTLSQVPFQVRLSASADMTQPVESEIVSTRKTDDFTAVVEVAGLEADTRYFYEALVDGEAVGIEPQPSIRTYPKTGSSVRFQVGFGGGANNRAENERMWDTIRSRNPLAFLFLGDNNYYNLPDVPEIQWYCYYRRHCRPEYRRMIATTSIYAIWDDHDFAGNDSIGGPHKEIPEWKRPVLRVFKENWLNPYYAGGENDPGCWHDFSIGDVDFFMLDCRYYRTDPQGKDPILTDSKAEHPSMLGPVQKRWLLDELKSSKGTFKILASSVPWTFGSKPGTQQSATFGRVPGFQDTWEGFPDEREEIFSFIEENKIEGVFLISADRHRSDAWRIERENGYDFYEANTSHLTKDGSHALMEKAIFSHKGKPMYGLLTFDTTKSDPEITYEVIDIDDRRVDKLTVNKSQLTFGP